MLLYQQARLACVVMDGGVWLWNIFADRFQIRAIGHLDFYHASQLLHALAAELFPGNPSVAHRWCADRLAHPPRPGESTRHAIRSAPNYFENHRDHLDYARAAKLGLPIGSGSMESQCSQFQNRFKRRGQFWMKRGFAGLLELSVRHQNGELAPPLGRLSPPHRRCARGGGR
ncbi:MAG: hypothetical protein KBC66_11540 [Kiritimatiellae bacterium]|nr:hypothetical protein [Kiritimatiellia bacterium]NLD88881.1 hypothetical protein [Lentisphaerota bacterium]HPC19525.1 hypothetical protein [Kiritimatiellia bacterium]